MESAASLFKQDFDLKKELNRLYDELRVINETQEILDSKWWKEYKQWAVQNVAGYDSQIIQLTENPKKNADELVRLHCLREILTKLVTSVEITVDHKDTVATKIEKYKRIINTQAL